MEKKIVKGILFISLFFLIFVLMNATMLSYSSLSIKSIYVISTILTIGLFSSRFLPLRFRRINHYVRLLSNFYVGAIFIFFITGIFFYCIEIFSQILGIALFNMTFLYFTLSTILVIISMILSQRLNIQEYEIQSSKVSKPYTIAHISDIHIGSNHKSSLKRIVTKLNEMNLDAICITGDLIDENISFSDVSFINDLYVKPFFVYGNHELYVNQKNLKKIVDKLHITILDETGILDNTIYFFGVSFEKSLKKVLLDKLVSHKNSFKKTFSILLYHEPKEIEIAKNVGFDLMLSGHTHAGQIWPFSLLVKLHYSLITGFHKIDEFYININPGTGTWGPRMRLGTVSEISIIKIIPKK